MGGKRHGRNDHAGPCRWCRWRNRALSLIHLSSHCRRCISTPLLCRHFVLGCVWLPNLCRTCPDAVERFTRTSSNDGRCFCNASMERVCTTTLSLLCVFYGRGGCNHHGWRTNSHHGRFAIQER